LCFWQATAAPELLIPAAGFCYLRLWLNTLDGMVAMASGKASRAGEIVNELPDRFSDAIIFVGAGHSGLCEPIGCYALCPTGIVLRLRSLGSFRARGVRT
jgi:phosphatidylglycerophosphate synthase